MEINYPEHELSLYIILLYETSSAGSNLESHGQKYIIGS